MSDEIELAPTSYIVLGLLLIFGEATPYDRKRAISASVGLGSAWLCTATLLQVAFVDRERTRTR